MLRRTGAGRDGGARPVGRRGLPACQRTARMSVTTGWAARGRGVLPGRRATTKGTVGHGRHARGRGCGDRDPQAGSLAGRRAPGCGGRLCRPPAAASRGTPPVGRTRGPKGWRRMRRGAHTASERRAGAANTRRPATALSRPPSVGPRRRAESRRPRGVGKVAPQEAALGASSGKFGREGGQWR